MGYKPPPGRPVSSPPCTADRPVSNPRPVRQAGEDKGAYGHRVKAWIMATQPEASARWHDETLAAVRKRTRKQRRIAADQCARLNRNESRGVWVTTQMVQTKKGFPDRSTAHRFIREHRLESRNVYGRIYIYLLRHGALPDDAVPAPLPPMPATVPMPPARPSLWQRFVSWFR